MNGTVSKVERENQQSPYHMNYNVDATNDVIENILSEEKKRAKDLLSKNMKIYKDLVQFAVGMNGITIDQFLTICNKHGLGLVEKEINDKLIYSYDNMVRHFLKQ
jgi:ATP-dependent Zn protease